MEKFFQVGIITSAHGVRGEVKVYPTTDDVRRFKRLKEVIVRTPAEMQDGENAENLPVLQESGEKILEIEGVKFFKQFAILKFRGIDRMEDAEKYRKCSLLVPRSNAVRLSRDEYFIADLMGLRVRTEDGTEIGRLTDVIETGANDVYVIKLDNGKELLLPAIRQCILQVDVEGRFIRVHILEGLMDET